MNRFNFKKKIISAIIITALALTGLAPSFAVCDSVMAAQTPKAPKVHGESVVLMDMGSGKVLFKKGEKIERQPASVTKILNLMVVLDNLDMDKEVTIHEGVETRGSVVGFEAGEVVKVKDLIYGMMLVSGNDAAEELAKATSGDVKSFCKLMNAKAKECGATKTNYKNSNGLNEDQSALNYTTAMDLAKISREAMKNPVFREVVGTVHYTIPATNKHEARKLRNSNHCMWDEELKIILNGDYAPLKYDGCNGIKTGYTSSAGNCYVGTATRGHTSLVVVVLGALADPERFEDAVDLWEYGFNNFKTVTVEKKDREVFVQKVKRGAMRDVAMGPGEDFMVTVAKNFNPKDNITTEVITDEKKAMAPIEEGDKLGYMVAYDNNGKELGKANVYALETVDEGGILSHIDIADEDVPMFIFIVALILIALVLILRLRNSIIRKRRARGRVSKKSGVKKTSRRKKSSGRRSSAKANHAANAAQEMPPVQPASEYPQSNREPLLRDVRRAEEMAAYEQQEGYEEAAAYEETARTHRKRSSSKKKSKSGKMTRSEKAQASHKRSKSRMKRHRDKNK